MSFSVSRSKRAAQEEELVMWLGLVRGMDQDPEPIVEPLQGAGRALRQWLERSLVALQGVVSFIR